MSLDNMKDFIDCYLAVPDDPKTPFMLSHELAKNIDSTHHLSVIVLSHALIDQILKDPSYKLFQVDFTHGLSCDDFLVCMVGTPNQSQEYCRSCRLEQFWLQWR